MIEKELNLRFLSEGPKQISVVVQDDELRRLTCNLVDIEIDAGATVQAYMYKPSGLVATTTGSVISTTQVRVDLTPQMLAETGTNQFQVKLLESGEAITSYEIPFMIRRDLAIESVESAADLTVLESLIEALIVGNIASAYDSTVSYSVGDIVSYDGAVYQCTTATTGTWDASDWSEVTTVDVLEALIAEAAAYAQTASESAYAITVTSTTLNILDE